VARHDISVLASEAEAERGLAQGKLLFVIDIPPSFDRSVDRGETPAILVDADATDPTAIGNATAALAALSTALDRDLPPVRQLPASAPPFQFVLHARYNPEQLTVLNIVPGLICVVLLISTLLVTALSITRDRERGTMENLLAMPMRPIEVMLAMIVPYVFVGYIQVVLILAASALFFVPFKGMPVRAQWVGEIFPTTHAMRVVRGLLLKGNGLPEILPELWPIALFALAAIMIAVWFYRETLD
jgi:ABC-2 type transport system permease protein